MRTAGTLALLGVVAYGATALAAAPVGAQPQAPSLTLSTTSGPAGTAFTATWTGLYLDRGCHNYSVQILWDGRTAIGGGSVGWRGSGSGSATVPSGATAGAHRVTAKALCDSSGSPSATFTVTAPQPTTTAPQPVPTTAPPQATTTAPTAGTTTRPGTSTTTPTTTTTTTTSTTSSSPAASTSASALPFGDGALTLDKDHVQPGDPLTATGTGCDPGSPVTLSSLGESVGAATADGTGRFSTRVEFTTVQPGRHVIRADCGIVLVGSVDVAVTSSTSGTTPTLLVLALALVLGAVLLRRQFAGLRGTG